MENFLAELHKKSDHHKKRFAFLASSTVTLFIFGLWSLATFGIPTDLIDPTTTYTASVDQSEQVAKVQKVQEKENEIGPFESLKMNLAASWQGLKETIFDIKKTMDTVDTRNGYGQ